MQGNTFQLVMVTDGMITYAMFLYPDKDSGQPIDALTWTTADSTGGIDGLASETDPNDPDVYPAIAGINSGNPLDYENCPGSGMRDDSILNLTRLSNTSPVQLPGQFIFRVDQATCECMTYSY